jgi:hypothetical protein
MRRAAPLIFALFVVGGCRSSTTTGPVPNPPPAPAQEDAIKIVKRAIEAHGGKANVAKLRTMRIKVEGTAYLVPGQPGVPFIIEDVWKMPDKYKTTSTVRIGAKDQTNTLIVNGNVGFSPEGGQLPANALAEFKEQKRGEDYDRFGFLSDANVNLTSLGEAMVDGKPGHAVLVKSEGHRDVKLWFQDESGLLVKREHSVLDPATNKEVNQEVVFGDFQDKDGVKHYMKIAAYRGGQKFFEGKVTEIQFLDKLDDSNFSRPTGKD